MMTTDDDDSPDDSPEGHLDSLSRLINKLRTALTPHEYALLEHLLEAVLENTPADDPQDRTKEPETWPDGKPISIDLNSK